jgi:hypothetical protein
MSYNKNKKETFYPVILALIFYFLLFLQIAIIFLKSMALTIQKRI